eukprot:CAMPEP_0113480156 /NCGR_PEP_ID=MMETSP0014_2-20120614/21719_1 /TAXON_ID=2857 /ORGANISM="Nitzschia sp." /LENGTH=47 /DNA_ID=CAMNT_0000373555 /DNA_START=22 /DNA_END=161 /DNA_ORIENTATION=- /assembly_acc=CAM_ASM_000159
MTDGPRNKIKCCRLLSVEAGWLLQINDKPVDPTWTIVDLQEALKCHG